MRRTALRWAAGALAILLLLSALPICIALLIDTNHLRAPFIRFVTARLGRPVQVQGAIEAHLLSLTPSVVAHGVSIGNPPWTAAGTTVEIGRLTLVLECWPLFGRDFEIRRLVAEDATLRLSRDLEGRANWQSAPPHTGHGGSGPPLIHGLTALRAHLELDDARRHLKFSGTVSAEGLETWHLESTGQLNGRPVSFALNGDPLSSVRHDRPYRFAFAERSSGSRLDGRGEVPQPFDFRVLEVSAEASGEDLKDLFFLLGVSLPDTGRYRLSAKIARQHSLFRYSDLSLSSGGSDLSGAFSIETKGGRASIGADLSSQALRSVDMGAAAAGRTPAHAGQQPSLLLPDAILPLDGLRSADAQIDYRAHAVQIGRMRLLEAVTHLAIDHGTLLLSPLSATLYQGKMKGSARLDASREPATAKLQLLLTDLHPTSFEHASNGPPSFDAPVQARIDLTGQGHSLHQFAAGANGTVTAVAPSGTLRAAFADLIGANFARGLGLLLTKDQKETGIRCGVASFEVKTGVMQAQTLLLDTDPVLIRGEGDIRLDTETIEIALHGQPKSRHLMQVREPVLVRGTLLHPSIGMHGGSGSVQTTKAVVIGIARAPLEAVGAVDADLAKNADCTALLQAAQQQGVPVK